MWRAGIRGAITALRNLSSQSQPSVRLPGTCSSVVQKVFNVEMAGQSEKNRVQMIEVVSQFQLQSGDTGSTPVQIAVLTFRIKHLIEHVKRNRKDFSCQRSLIKMVQKRRKLLNYLQRTDYLAYQSVLARLQLRPLRTQTYSRT